MAEKDSGDHVHLAFSSTARVLSHRTGRSFGQPSPPGPLQIREEITDRHL